MHLQEHGTTDKLCWRHTPEWTNVRGLKVIGHPALQPSLAAAIVALFSISGLDRIRLTRASNCTFSATEERLQEMMARVNMHIWTDDNLTGWCPIAKLVNITSITMVFVGDISIVSGIIIHLMFGVAPPCTNGHCRPPDRQCQRSIWFGLAQT